ncbi:ribosome small subunit-dependent GTPase A [Saccharicrinis sp. FJH54]|uniref:ribosome small subunit-dependent GTPase A n=1 Tax=Saccharicrinis sp. FJH54 TaxID=3344665 RepID=UPI0035D3DA12
MDKQEYRMNLKDLGYDEKLERFRNEQGYASFGVGRVISEHKERYKVKTADHECDAEIVGNLRFSAQSRSDFPAVGDWVAVSEYDNDKLLIHAVFPRKNMLERQAVGKKGETQIIAANIDYAFIVQAVDRDFNLNRIERYLTICNTSGVRPVVVLNKTDLLDETAVTKLISLVRERIALVPVLAISNETLQGIKELKAGMEKGKTYCLLGSSGVGKSTLLNQLAGHNQMKTGSISSSTSKGRHITSHRELHVLENGGILIDNPGMREVGMTDSTRGLEMTFDDIIRLSKDCKYKDCTHTTEKGCAIIAAVENEEIDRSSYDNYIRMEREKAHFESTVAEKRKKDKDLGKIIRDYKKNKKMRGL